MVLWFFHYYCIYLFFICVCFLCLCFVCLLCVYVCVYFFAGWVFFFLTGSLQLYQRQELNKNVVACVVCYSGSKYGTHFLITRVYYGFRPNKITDMFLVPARTQKSRRTCFSLYILFSNFPQENGAKTFSSTRSDIRYRLIRKNVAHSWTGDVWCQIIEAMVWQYCSRV